MVFGYPLVEVLAAWGVATWIGWGWTLLLLVAGIPLGFSIMRRAARHATAEMRAQRVPAPADAATFIGGLAIAIPGFVTDLIGLALVIPITRRLLVAAIGPALQSRMAGMRVPGSGYTGPGYAAYGDVIIGEVVVTEDVSRADDDPQAPRGLEPR